VAVKNKPLRARAPHAFLTATRHVGVYIIDLFQLALDLVAPWMVMDAKQKKAA
jgi:hypothetical protein